eukprot:TRINITY_DN44885_c0_g1_i1.p1 TRINITY_DN44885_c0_g1~~TRINITY_DN44885_c0_g1_i1.p1  ORF type:complete len:1346 (-),score=282.28 TRINITY_DN44885_c0_g1_i1:59-4096(-)
MKRLPCVAFQEESSQELQLDAGASVKRFRQGSLTPQGDCHESAEPELQEEPPPDPRSFPVHCELHKSENGAWLLQGQCSICRWSIRRNGSAKKPLREHASAMLQVVQHVQVEHRSTWSWRRNLAAPDPDKRIVWTLEQEGCPDTRIAGKTPTVLLRASATQPPSWLFPRDAAFKKDKPAPGRCIKTEVSKKTLADATAAGIEAAPSWEGLGQVPPELERGGFRSLLIVGPSGSGKSTLLRALLEKLYPSHSGHLYPQAEWSSRSLIEAFPTAEQGTRALAAAGLGSVPTWTKPYDVLSTGERYRANLARVLASRATDASLPVVLDEWTSELDRDIAQVLCLAMRKHIEREAAGVSKKTAGADKAGQPAASQKETLGSHQAAGCEAWVQEGMKEEDADWPEWSQEGGEEETPVVSDAEDGEDWDEAGTQETEAITSGEEHEMAGSERAASKPSPQGERSSEQRGPYIFASCHDDVAKNLQPDVICLCEVGRAPRLLWRKYEQMPPRLSASLFGQMLPLPLAGGSHLLAGHWVAALRDSKGRRVGKAEGGCFRIEMRGPKEHDMFTLVFQIVPGHQTVEKVNELRPQTQDAAAPTSGAPDGPGPWYEGASNQASRGLVRIRLLSSKKLELQRRLPGSKTWGVSFTAQRRMLPGASEAVMLAADPRAVWSSSAVLDYTDCDVTLLGRIGWYLPPEYKEDAGYSGLQLSGKPQLIRDSAFSYNAAHTTEAQRSSNNRYLTTYVGEADGSLNEKLKEVCKLLDCPFNGLCIHGLLQLPEKSSRFGIGVITGPSGSGKSSLTRVDFASSLTVSWKADVAVLGHFSTLVKAKDLLEAVHLDATVAMRPYSTLSVGEQARARVARILAEAAQSKRVNDVWVLDEFTSTVDRATAFHMARGLQRVVRQWKLQNILVVSCHNDFVAKGFLEPDWLLECHTGRFLRFQTAGSTAAHSRPVPAQCIALATRARCKRSDKGPPAEERPTEELLSDAKKLKREAQESGADEDATALKQLLATATAIRQRAGQRLEDVKKELKAHAEAVCFSERFRQDLATMSRVIASLGEEEMARQAEAIAALEARCGSQQSASTSKSAASQRALRPQPPPAPVRIEEEVEANCESAALPAGLQQKMDVWSDIGRWIKTVYDPPIISLEVRRAFPREWKYFREHHYKDHSLSGTCVAFVGLLAGRATCFCAVVPEAMNFVHRSAQAQISGGRSTAYPGPWLKSSRKLFREHRTVVLPDFQGMGLAPLLCDAVGSLFLSLGHDFTSQTVHPFYGSYRDRSPFWAAFPSSRTSGSSIKGNLKYSHFFIGAYGPDGSIDREREAALKARVSNRKVITAFKPLLDGQSKVLLL